MKNLIIICFLSFLPPLGGYAAGERTPAGGRSQSMGGTSVAQSDFWSLSNNQAGTAWLTRAGAGMACENHFLVKALSCEQLGLALPVRAGTFGLIVNRWGNIQYSEIKAGLSYARKFGKYFAVGIQFDYFRIQVTDGYGSKNLATCEIGLMYQADRHFSVGVQVVNPVPVKITDHPTEQLPSVICIGLSYRFSDDFLVNAEAEKDMINPVVFRTGAEYHIARPAFVRIGLSTGPMSFTFGFGLEFGKIRFDIASGYHQALGFSPSGSFIYSFR
ncbi:MAG: hypothetical protein NT040_13980 [Bacteroidetes bacterium]|nr:hypothetical protein [Bacteroidota bacterium]